MTTQMLLVVSLSKLTIHPSHILLILFQVNCGETQGIRIKSLSHFQSHMLMTVTGCQQEADFLNFI